MSKTLLISDIETGLYIVSKNKAEYKDGHSTGRIENVVTTLASKAGEIHIILPYVEGREDELENRFSFGAQIEVREVFDVQDIKISIYKDELSIKVFADYVEGK